MDSSGSSYEPFLSRKYFASLDGLRCLSILMVIWHHAQAHAGKSRGYLGVALFFVISGFLITTLLLRERQLNGQIAMGQFYLRRSLRIFPLYYAVLALYTLLVLIQLQAVPASRQACETFFSNLPYYLSYTSNWFVRLDAGPHVIFYFAWSLATEEQFYLVWPWIMRWMKRWYAPVLVAALAIAAKQAADRLSRYGLIDAASLPVLMVSSIAIPICLGCILACLLQRRRGFALGWPVLGAVWSAPLALAATVAAILTPSLSENLVFLAMTWLVGACCIRADHLLRPILDNACVQYIGRISYGMYLLHMLAMNAARRFVPGSEDRPLTLFLVSAVLTVAAASFSHRFIERPFLAFKNRLRTQPEPPDAETSPEVPTVVNVSLVKGQQ